MKTAAQFLGHPIHPMLVVFPLGLFPVSLVFDLVFVVSGDAFWYLAAFWVLVAGVIGTALAAVPGMVDYFATVQERAGTRTKDTATRHFVTGLVVLVVFVVVAGLHWRNLTPPGTPWLAVGANAVGNLLLGYQGYLGGSLTYHHGVGVDEAGERAGPDAGGRAQPRRGGRPES